MSKNKTNTIQPSQIFDLLDIEDKDREMAERLLSLSYSFLISLDVGDKLVLSSTTFSKIDTDLIQIEVSLNPKNIIDELKQRKIIKIPL